ncbi:MAG: putative sigma-54 modulation protein [Patescibacteria group bacterium]|nr:putative sigma-54 modulation protein [Patescibacteria group bacterium]
MKISIKATNIEITPAIEQYLFYKLSKLEKYLDESESEALVDVEIGKTTEHHRHGQVFKAEINLVVPGQVMRRANIEGFDLYSAIVSARDEIVSQIKISQDKNTTMFRRGARKIKDMMRGY